MVTAVEPLTDVTTWARGSGLEILLLVTGAMLLTRFASWLGAKITTRIDANAQESDALVRSEAAKHRHALTQVVTWTALVLIYCVAAVLIVARLGVPLSGLVAPATVAGVALGFGAQRIVQDLLAGFFVITERQYGFGDVIRLTIPGTGVPVQGTVVDVSLRVTQMRTINGEVVITPNGQIVQATNLSRDWARAVVDVPVPSTADVSRVTAILQHVGAAAYADDDLRPLLLDEPTGDGCREHRGRPAQHPRRGPDAAGQAVRRRPRAAHPHRRCLAQGRHHCRAHAGHRSPEQPGMRFLFGIRVSTLALTVIFAALLTLYLLVRPPHDVATVAPPQTTATPASTPHPSRTTHSPKPSKTSTKSQTATPSTSVSGSPSSSGSPTGGPASPSPTDTSSASP